jgi:hypothetical protein
MSDNEPPTASEEPDFGSSLEPDFDKYGTRKGDSSIGVLRIDEAKSMFERVGTVDPRPTGVVLKETTELSDKTPENTAEASFKDSHTVEIDRPIRFVSNEVDGFETRARNAIFDLIYDEKLPKEAAANLAAELTDDVSE